MTKFGLADRIFLMQESAETQRLAIYTGEALDELEKQVAPTTARRVRAMTSPKQ